MGFFQTQDRLSTMRIYGKSLLLGAKKEKYENDGAEKAGEKRDKFDKNSEKGA